VILVVTRFGNNILAAKLPSDSPLHSQGRSIPVSSYASSTKVPGTILLQGKGLSIYVNSFLVQCFVRALAIEHPLPLQWGVLVNGLPSSYQGQEVVGVLKRGHEFAERYKGMQQTEDLPPHVWSSRTHIFRKPACLVRCGPKSP
jgi:hypothetical protein